MPQDNELAIDLRQTAVVIMAHLDRLATPCMPPQCSSPTSHKVIACNIKCSKMFSLKAKLNFRMKGKQLLRYFKFFSDFHNITLSSEICLGWVTFIPSALFQSALECNFIVYEPFFLTTIWLILSYFRLFLVLLRGNSQDQTL